MPPSFKERWNRHIVLPLSVHPHPRWRSNLGLSFSGISNLLSLPGGASVSFGYISSSTRKCSYFLSHLLAWCDIGVWLSVHVKVCPSTVSLTRAIS